MNRFHIESLSSLLVLALSLGCSESEESSALATSKAALTGQNGISATAKVTSNWSTGYCTDITVTNGHSTATTGTWKVVVNVGAARTYTTYNGTFSSNTGSISVTPASWNARIAPNGGTAVFGFCVNKSNPSDQPEVASVTSDLPGTSSNPWTKGLFRVASRADRLTMTATSATALAGAAYHGGQAQQWRFVEYSGGTMSLVNESNQLCLTSSGTQVAMAACSPNNTHWLIETLRTPSVERPGLYRLRTASATQCLALSGSGAPTLTSCNDAARLYLEPVGYGERSYPQEVEMKGLLIVKPTTSVTNPAVSSTIPADIVTAVRTAFRDRVATWYERMTDGRVKWSADTVVSPRPLTRLSVLRTDANGVPDLFWPYASDMADDVTAYMPVGKYDGAITYWTSGNLDGGWGWGTAPGAASSHAGWGAANYNAWITTPDVWTSWSHEPTEVFIHEFLEEITMFYDGLGVPLPQDHVHGAGPAQYTNVADGWKPWYRDYLLGTVISPNDTYEGLGPRAWAQGTLKDLALTHVPAFLTPERLAQNLLTNGGFEGTNGAAPAGWTWDPWLSDGRTTGVIDTTVRHSGSSSLRIRSTAENDARYIQRITAQPNQRYVLAGWVKTQGVGGSGSTGGNVGDMHGGALADPSLAGTQDWTYVSSVFVTGADGIIDVAARLGHYGSTVTGTAWFDDLVLVRY